MGDEGEKLPRDHLFIYLFTKGIAAIFQAYIFPYTILFPLFLSYPSKIGASLTWYVPSLGLFIWLQHPHWLHTHCRG